MKIWAISNQRRSPRCEMRREVYLEQKISRIVCFIWRICFFFLKKCSDSLCCWKKYSDFGGGKKKKSESEFLSFNLMLNSGKKICALRDKQNKYSNSRVVQKKFLNETKNHNSPLQVKWSVPKNIILVTFSVFKLLSYLLIML